MKRILIYWTVVAQMLFAIAVIAQASSLSPKHFASSFPIDTIPKPALEHNSEELLTREFLNTNTVKIIADSLNLTESERQRFLVAPGPAGEGAWIYLIDASKVEAHERFAERFCAYVRQRVEGHSRAWTLRAVTNRIQPQSVTNGDLQTLIAKAPYFPDSWLKRENSGSITNRANSGPLTIVRHKSGQVYVTNAAPNQVAGSVVRSVSFIGIDSEIAWRYTLFFSPVDSLERIDEWRMDAKEFDPKYKDTFEAVEKEIEIEYPRSGRRFGSHIVYVQMKKKKLKALGVDWRTPDDLNPGVHFD